MINNVSDFGLASPEKILNIEETAELLGISTATVRNWVKCRQIPTHKKKNKHFFYRSDIEKIKLKLATGELKKLNKRANKLKARRVFIPKELMKTQANFNEFNRIISFIKKNNIKTTTALFLLSLNFLKKERILLKTSIKDIIENKNGLFANQKIQKEIKAWLLGLKNQDILPYFSFLLDCDLPEQRDILGIFYQSLLFEGEKSQNGSYYSPSNIVNDIITDYVKKDSKVLDPCCGTGQFLLAYADIVENPLNIYGMDCDKTAVRIARINILTKFILVLFEFSGFDDMKIISNKHGQFSPVFSNTS